MEKHDIVVWLNLSHFLKSLYYKSKNVEFSFFDYKCQEKKLEGKHTHT